MSFILEVGSLADWVSGLATAGALFWAIKLNSNENRKRLTILFRHSFVSKKNGIIISDGKPKDFIITPVNNSKFSLEINFRQILLVPSLMDRLLFRAEPKQLSNLEALLKQLENKANWQIIKPNLSGKPIMFDYEFIVQQIKKYADGKKFNFAIEIQFIDSTSKIFKYKEKLKLRKIKDL
ncbi:hypothetical protein [Listeria monocytogenes]|uniref:hypothetical protein n=1 Tax=Listeria monocytogenes TaxID=1639 RepID=UPI000C867E33|nr:hypothetical protein [Listeria monocytogenes]EHC6163383.1 hypothetical protein [Listeria monocytogenes serotype 1/2a]EAC4791444.1 hypothetical protein [Listeria monocytogenes]EAC8175881.1 hypothetical protein [Listeria monocytogenes]EAD3269026.1 hypothetical protein [Listeria monocytogenes]EAD3277186.1 hypothetical protein [Listeria monocytogenes]